MHKHNRSCIDIVSLTCREHLVDERDGVESLVVKDVDGDNGVVAVVVVASLTDVDAINARLFGAPRVLLSLVVLLLVPRRESSSSSQCRHLELHTENRETEAHAHARGSEREGSTLSLCSAAAAFF